VLVQITLASIHRVLKVETLYFQVLHLLAAVAVVNTTQTKLVEMAALAAEEVAVLVLITLLAEAEVQVKLVKTLMNLT
jgi:hypothetical protein